MARQAAVDLSALSTILSFLYISRSLERHSLTERPRLSSVLVLFFSGCICLAVSALAAFAPAAAEGNSSEVPSQNHGGALSSVEGSHGENSPSRDPRAHLSSRPRKWFLPALVILAVFRLEIFHRVNYQQQCSTPGIESFLCLLLIGHQIFVTRRKWEFVALGDPDDPWRSAFDDIHDWFSGTRVVMVNSVLSALVFSLGTFLSVSQINRSGYLCLHALESHAVTVVLQLAGLGFDAAILVLAWRMLARARTTRERMWLLGSVLLLTALPVSLLYLGTAAFRGFRSVNDSLGALYGFDVVTDSLAFAALWSSLSFWICEANLITPFSILTFLVGMRASCAEVFHKADWLHLAPFGALAPLWMSVIGFVPFTYLQGIQTVVFIKRIVFVGLLAVVLLVATVRTLLKEPDSFKRHPISDLIYNARTEHDRWLTVASTSQSISAAVDVYQERHEGRRPPPNFGKWYEYARGALVMDDFPQIDRDLDPFWHLSPTTLRQRAEEMAATVGTGAITIKDGRVTFKVTGSAEGDRDLAELVKMISKFSSHLPDMVLPINLSPTPRILPTWEDASPRSKGAAMSSMAEVLSKRGIREYNQQPFEVTGIVSSLEERPAGAADDSMTGSAWGQIWASDFRQMQVGACSPLSRSRTRPHWNFIEFCAECVEAHSGGQLVTRWHESLDTCSQPDLRLLHGFSLTDPVRVPIRQLRPLFGASKTDEFKDIVIPIPVTAGTRTGNEKDQKEDKQERGQGKEEGKGEKRERPDSAWPFADRSNGLIWRGNVGERGITNQALRGGHKLRLLHLANTPYPHDEVTMMLPTPGNADVLGYEKLKASEANQLVRLRVGISNGAACRSTNCALVQAAYGEGSDDGEGKGKDGMGSSAEPLKYRHVLLIDEDDGPPREMMRTLRSGSVPFVSSIFRTWFTDRLTPWLHFVPIDPRYHGLHTTLAYFAGAEGQPHALLHGRNVSMAGNAQDAEWIAQQGQKWAERALGERDMEVYVFRLLLEWGRVTDDLRNEIGFRKDENGDFQNVGWTRQQQQQQQQPAARADDRDIHDSNDDNNNFYYNNTTANTSSSSRRSSISDVNNSDGNKAKGTR